MVHRAWIEYYNMIYENVKGIGDMKGIMTLYVESISGSSKFMLGEKGVHGFVRLWNEINVNEMY